MEEGIAAQQRAIRLSPRDPKIAIWYCRIGEAHLLQSHIDDAVIWFERARTANPEIPFIHSYLASAYALHGEAKKAAVELAEAERLDGMGNFSSIARRKLRTSLSQGRGARQTVHALFEATYYAGLRLAGMPEE